MPEHDQLSAPASSAHKAARLPLKAPPQAVPGVFIVHAAPFSVPLDAEATHTTVSQRPVDGLLTSTEPRRGRAAATVGRSRRRPPWALCPPSSVTTGTGAHTITRPDTFQAAHDYKWRSRMSPLGHKDLGGKRSSVSSYASPEAYARAYVQSEVGAATRLRSTDTSLANGRLHSLHSGTLGPPAPALFKTEEQHCSLMDNNVMKQTVKTVAPILWIFVVYGLLPVRFKPGEN
ncbi:uncharacterized protein LOC113216566 isoform X1 [Frankliniella occidentalis]|uniref:Uncharacterized protein LOC113216566 isoform X1 n=1 Tax=Frankliniella occidentalis TaxID=133901 RepID=A0A9C6X6Z1_FRAOC|nr:uncharacterized protein LOC113216566 isoform X1 [Frankliniella occidentalis]